MLSLGIKQFNTLYINNKVGCYAQLGRHKSNVLNHTSTFTALVYNINQYSACCTAWTPIKSFQCSSNIHKPLACIPTLQLYSTTVSAEKQPESSSSTKPSKPETSSNSKSHSSKSSSSSSSTSTSASPKKKSTEQKEKSLGRKIWENVVGIIILIFLAKLALIIGKWFVSRHGSHKHEVVEVEEPPGLHKEDSPSQKPEPPSPIETTIPAVHPPSPPYLVAGENSQEIHIACPHCKNNIIVLNIHTVMLPTISSPKSPTNALVPELTRS